VNTAERVTGNKINQVWLNEGREETENTKEDSYLTFQGAKKTSLVVQCTYCIVYRPKGEPERGGGMGGGGMNPGKQTPIFFFWIN
jgi:hypothetical protein